MLHDQVNREDPAMAAARNIDWELFIETHDYRYGIIIQGFAQGKALNVLHFANRAE